MEDKEKFRNVLFEKVEYKIEKTNFGQWRKHMTPVGSYYAEFTSHASMFGLPLFHYTRGINPETGKRKIAVGVVAVGRVAAGGIAIGQASFGIIAIGQLAIGLALGFGQLATGAWAVGQLAIGGLFGAGQLASGVTAIGQLAVGKYLLCQIGFGEFVWSPERADPEAVTHFNELYSNVRELFLGL